MTSTSRSEWKFRHWEDSKWYPFRDEERGHFLALPAGEALDLLDGAIPVVIKRGDTIICSGNVVAEIKRKYQRVATMEAVRGAFTGKRVTLREMLEE